MDAKRFLMKKGVMSMSETVNVLTVQQWLTEFAEQYHSERSCEERLGEIKLSENCPRTGKECLQMCCGHCKAQ